MRFNREMSNSREDNLKRIIHLMQTDNSADAPADAVRWSKNIFRTRAKQPTVVERIKAVLTADLKPGKAVFGERSGTAQARQMLFGAGERAVDLRISASEEGFEVRGQILGEGFENCSVKLGDLETVANERAEFILTGVPAGTWDLEINNGEEMIEIEEIQVS